MDGYFVWMLRTQCATTYLHLMCVHIVHITPSSNRCPSHAVDCWSLCGGIVLAIWKIICNKQMNEFELCHNEHFVLFFFFFCFLSLTLRTTLHVVVWHRADSKCTIWVNVKWERIWYGFCFSVTSQCPFKTMLIASNVSWFYTRKKKQTKANQATHAQIKGGESSHSLISSHSFFSSCINLCIIKFIMSRVL